ncbi:MAG: hypothetical protein KatS3mg033_0549 [Thermonema sp.]|uniref:YceI family protein n=1 Tax=Thermonema TaxID=28194 RepID=UPI0006910F41|nr:MULTISPECIES: YceI family protein [Thermonema]GIV38749.1 MAG: hypothetical protein KatS3mg033_0549 [Thermonema sp.]
MKKIILSFGLAALLWSCGSQETKQEKTNTDSTQTTQASTECRYRLGETTLTWTAYKFTEKAGVSGSFKEYQVESPLQEATSLQELIKGASITIKTGSVDTQNPDRDAKIAKYFFGSFAQKEGEEVLLKARLDSVISDTQALLSIEMNGINKQVPVELTLSEEKVSISTTINVEEWNAGSGIKALNEVCKDLHTGPDGKSVLWPEVKLYAEAAVNKDCQ